ncbi:bifunctional isocitrate dehydrogenase kinase/phosphatase [soil metagenome]
MTPSDSRLSNLAARTIIEAFIDFGDRYRIVTRRARLRFIEADWSGMASDARQRLDIYGKAVGEAIAALETLLGERLADRRLWSLLKAVYSGLIVERPDWEIAETFFNSVTRKIFTTVGVDSQVEFVDSDFDSPPSQPKRPVYRSYDQPSDIDGLICQIVIDANLGIDLPDLRSESERAASRIGEHLRKSGDLGVIDRVDLVDSVFYRGKAAYLVGRVASGAHVFPMVLAILNVKGGHIDAVLLTENQVSILFSFTRSYFHVDVERPHELIGFLSSLMPRKRLSELYIAIGQHKHGKTLLYRELLSHLAHTGESFTLAQGTKGLVMVVFTIPGFDVVIKVIKDRFPAPKRTTRSEVRERYRLVFRVDRAGRLVDAQEFEYLEFDRRRFSPALLEVLVTDCARSVLLTDEQVVIRHAYIERRVIPLDMYLRDSSEDLAAAAIIDYGAAIKELGATGIFPGDLLLKNFGVTRHGRVVFYDYDELTTIDRVVFRRLPDDESMGDEPTFGVGPDDVFPEEFIRFLGVDGELKKAFLSNHRDLLTADWWLGVQKRVAARELIDIFPYEERLASGQD